LFALIEQTNDAVDHLPAWLAFSGAAIVALIAAVTAERRLNKQLKAEGERLGKQLEAEQERLESQLAHDRQLADLAELRTILDDGAARLTTILDKYTDVWGVLPSKGQEHSPEKLSAMKTTLEAVWPEVWPIYGITERLELRLGQGAPIVKAMRGVSDKISQQIEEMNGWAEFPDEGELEEARRTYLAEVASARGAFLKEAEKLAHAVTQSR
jgi:hypothetical protein